MDIDTIGLAGDSAITISWDRRLALGPRRAEPLSVLASTEPQVLAEMERLLGQEDTRSSLIQPVEFFRVLKSQNGHELSRTEALALEVLRDGPLSRDQLGKLTGAMDPSMVPTGRLESLGLLQRSTLTPTDILHVRGDFLRWNAPAARLGLRLFAQAMRLSDDAMANLVFETFIQQVTERLVGRLLRQKAPQLQDGTNQRHHEFKPSRAGSIDHGLLQLMLSNQNHLGFSLSPSYKHPLIGIGAPAAILAPGLAKRLGARLVIPEHAEVANAIGAIISMEYLSIEAVVSPKDGGFVVHGPLSRKTFADLKQAKNWAAKHVMRLLEERIAAEGQTGLPYQKDIQVKDSLAGTPWGPIFVESTVRAVGVCKPALG